MFVYVLVTYRDVMFAAEPEPCECDYRQTMEDFCKSNYFGEVMRVYEPIKNPVYTNAMYVGLGILNVKYFITMMDICNNFDIQTTTNFPYRFLHLDLTKLPERCRGNRTSSPFWIGGECINLRYMQDDRAVAGTLFENLTLSVGRCLYKLNEEVLNRTRSFLPSRNMTCQIHFGKDWVGNMMLN
ncbi:unnamed protein product [Cylicocyclus nassatus]|uniref:Uncharacterized protein n=1 Tax=Cylicocyclus nassatus TaxID=53992 RepID=A0AA36GU70_CYLNA|nr:unnamed protein product [Cylicocyclus nassatus]